MAALPCDVHHEPRPGRLIGAYLSFVVDGQRKTKYRRLCLDCGRELLIKHQHDWLDKALKGELDGRSTCTACGTVFNGHADLVRFYATVYPNGKDRRDYTATYCGPCMLQLAEEFDFDV